MLVDRFAARVMRSRRSTTSAAGKMRVAWVVLFLGMLKAKSHKATKRYIGSKDWCGKE